MRALPALLLSACLFDTETPPPASTSFEPELALLSEARNPLLAAYGAQPGGSVVGLQFAFLTTRYAREVDSNLEAFHAQTGVYPAAVGAYFDFTTRPENLAIFLAAAQAQGCVPSVTLDPKVWIDPHNRKPVSPNLGDQKTFIGLIQAGRFDSQLDAWARVLRDFDHPVLLRFAHEMNGNWYPYGGGGDADGDGHADGPEAFIRAWRHVHDRFAAAGAVNLIWVFCPNGEDFPDASWNRPFRYYPGDAYANMISVDAYEHREKRTQSLSDAVEPFLGRLGQFLRERRAAGNNAVPAFGLGEFGTNRKDPASKAEWYRQSLRYLGEETRIGSHFLYNGQDAGQDFSLRDIGGLIEDAYHQPAFRYRFIDLPLPKRFASIPLR
jgi:hypothetical protein